MKRIFIIGTGNMGGAVASALSEDTEYEVFVFNRTREKAEKKAEGKRITVLDSIPDGKNMDAVILAVKPQQMDSVYAEAAALDAGMYISLAAGVTLEALSENLKTQSVVRYMPNIAAEVKSSVTAVAFSSDLSEEKKALALALASSFGSAFELDESLFNAFIGISGSGIAYVFEFMHSLALGGVREGIPYKKALEIVTDTLESAVKLQKSGAEGAIENETMVCSPKGTTIEGLVKLKELNFENAVISAVSAASEKGRALGKKD